MNDFLPREILLIAQAAYKDGAGSFEAISQRLQSHPSTASRAPGSFSPAACFGVYKQLLAGQGVAVEDKDAIPPEYKRSMARKNLEIAHGCYAARLSEIRRAFAMEEDYMKKLIQETEAIQRGEWDARLMEEYTQSQQLHKPPSLRHGQSQPPILDSISEEAAPLILAPSITRDRLSSPNKASSSSAHPTSPNRPTTRSSRSPERIATASSDRASEQPISAGLEEQLNASDGAGVFHDIESNMEDVVPSSVPTEAGAADNQAVRGGHRKARSVSTRGTKPSLPERRTSTRGTRHSIAGISDVTQPLGPPLIAPEGPSAIRVDEVEAVLPENVDEEVGVPDSADSPQSVAMDRDSSKESVARRGGMRGMRRTSIPPGRDAFKRKRGQTPTQGSGSGRAGSPALSDLARNKRIKTEEADSSIGTPDIDRNSAGPSTQPATMTAKRFRATVVPLISQMQSSVYSTYFKDPVRQGEAANYFEIVRRPMDYKSLLQNLKAGRVTNSVEFARDLALIFANAIMYNGKDHHVSQDAAAMWKEAQGLLRVLEAAEQRMA